MTWPRRGRQAPTSRRASNDLPAPLGPTTPRMRPGFMTKETSLSSTVSRLGAVTVARATASGPSGRGRESLRVSLSMPASTVSSRSTELRTCQ